VKAGSAIESVSVSTRLKVTVYEHLVDDEEDLIHTSVILKVSCHILCFECSQKVQHALQMSRRSRSARRGGGR